MSKWSKETDRNRALYKADKHSKGKNSYNPLAGWSDKQKEKHGKKM